MELDEMPSINELSNSESLFEYAKNADVFLRSHLWCNDTISGHLAYGWEDILGVFLFQILPNDVNVDDTLWVVSGTIPIAYIVYQENPLPSDALTSYVYELRKWVIAAQSGESVANLVPVRRNDSFELIEPTEEFVEVLDKKLNFIESELLSELKQLKI